MFVFAKTFFFFVLNPKPPFSIVSLPQGQIPILNNEKGNLMVCNTKSDHLDCLCTSYLKKLEKKKKKG